MKRILITAAALFALTGAASAADIYKGGLKDAPAPVAEFTPSWTAFWIGIGPSYDGVNHKLTLTDGPVNSDGYGGNSATLNGIGGEDVSFIVTAGANYQFPNSRLVVGIGGDYKFANAASSLAYNTQSLSYTMTDYVTAWARIGYLVNPATLAYFKGGYGWATFHPGGLLANTTLGDHTFDGGLIGAGLETRLDSIASGLTARLEYTYLDANDASLSSGAYTLTDRLNVNSVNLVFAYNIGGGYVPLK